MQSVGDCGRTRLCDVPGIPPEVRSERQPKLRAAELLGIRGVVPGICGGAAAGAVEVQMKNRLRVLRAERNWSQADLAQRLEVSRQSVNAIETGKFDPSLPLAFRLARLFEMTIEQVFIDNGST